MRCQLCDKHASVHLTEIINGEKIERHLCDECAEKEGITIKSNVPLSELLSSLATAQQEARAVGDLHCPQCDISWSQFRKSGLLGCPHDYEAFGKPMLSLIKRAQEGAVKHIGRIPHNTSNEIKDQIRLLRLRQDLQHAVEHEEYETAANIRDEISKLTSN